MDGRACHYHSSIRKILNGCLVGARLCLCQVWHEQCKLSLLELRGEVDLSGITPQITSLGMASLPGGSL